MDSMLKHQAEVIKGFFGAFELPIHWAVDLESKPQPMLMAAFSDGVVRWATLSPEKRFLAYFENMNTQEFRRRYNFWRGTPWWRFPQN
jgi:hypothetical protein